MIIDNKKIELIQAVRNLGTLDLLNLTGISSQTFGRIKKSEELKPTTVFKIAKGLNVPVSEIVKTE